MLDADRLGTSTSGRMCGKDGQGVPAGSSPTLRISRITVGARVPDLLELCPGRGQGRRGRPAGRGLRRRSVRRRRWRPIAARSRASPSRPNREGGRRPVDLGRASGLRPRGRPFGRRGARRGRARARERAARSPPPIRSTRSRPPSRSSRSTACSPGSPPMTTDEKVLIALGMERAATTTDAHPQAEAVRYGTPSGAADRPPRGVRAGTRDGVLGRRRHARRAGGRHADGFSYRIARGSRTSTTTASFRGRGTRGADARRHQTRDRSCPGAASIRSPRRRSGRPVRRPVGRGRAEASDRCSGRWSASRWRPTCSRSSTTAGFSTGRRGASRSTARGVPTGRTEFLSSGVLNGFLHNTYTARRGVRVRRATPFPGVPSTPVSARRTCSSSPAIAPSSSCSGRQRAASSSRTSPGYLGAESDQRRVLGGRDRSADLGWRSRAAGARDDREHAPEMLQSVAALGASSDGSPRSGSRPSCWAR